MKVLNKFFVLAFLVFIISCTKDDAESINPEREEMAEEMEDSVIQTQGEVLTIFFVNDQHGSINNFSKIKHIVDQSRAETNTLLVCAGDIFSGNPIVDQYEKKGFPMIDLMNKTGFDVSVLGNHEFDYGIEILKDRMNQAEFAWVCANVDMKLSGVPQPNAFTSMLVGGLKITFLGLVETNGKQGATIPSTHPWRVSDLEFEKFYDVIDEYQQVKENENSDLFIALTHLGTGSDMSLAENNSFIDVVIGGHSHQIVNELVGSTPVVQAGSNLSRLGKMTLKIEDKSIVESSVEFINLSSYNDRDEDLQAIIDVYNDEPSFDRIVGFADSYHDRTEIGCFYTTALKEYMQVDASFQNTGGIRADIDEGDITALEIYNMDPFNNQSVIFTMTAGEISAFFSETGARLHVSGISMEQTQNGLKVFDENGHVLDDNDILTIGINDYIPAVYDQYFPLEKADIQDLTTAETIIEYLDNINSTLSYDDCDRVVSF